MPQTERSTTIWRHEAPVRRRAASSRSGTTVRKAESPRRGLAGHCGRRTPRWLAAPTSSWCRALPKFRRRPASPAGLAQADRSQPDFAALQFIDTPDAGAPVVPRVLERADRVTPVCRPM